MFFLIGVKKYMKKSLFFLAVFAFLAVSAYAQPKIEVVGGDVVDWKDVTPKDDPLKSEVIIKNVGTETLKITEVKPTCGCTTAPLGKYELAPGETTNMQVTLTIGSTSGRQHKSIRIASNDPSSPTKIVSLRANVIRPIEIKPTPYFTFNNMEVGKEATSKLFIKNNTNQNITFSDFKTTPDFMKINVTGSKVLKPGEEFELTATITPQKSGYINPSLKFKTSHQDTPEVDIRGYGNVKESAIFNPRE